VKVLDAMLASLNPGMERAEDDGEIEGFFAFGPVEGKAAADEPARLIPEPLQEPAKPACFIAKVSGAVQADR